MSRITRTNRIRLIIAFALLAALFVVLALRLAWIQVVKSDEYTDKAIAQQTSDIPVEANRGDIYDREGRELATSAVCYSVWARPKEIASDYKGSEKIDEISSQLASILNMSTDDVKKALTNKDTVLVRIAQYLDKSTADKIRKLKISGIQISEGTKRYYPLGTSASKLLGSVTDDNVGRSGVEAMFDTYLAGVPGRWLKDNDINGNTLAFGSNELTEAKDGDNITLTIDSVLQHYAELAVAAGLKKTKADKIYMIVMDPKTGDILAEVNNPGFDPNDATQPATSAERKKFAAMSNSEKTKYLSEMWRDPVVSDTYEPGSTFKVITTSAALEEGITTPNTRYYDPGFINVDGTRLYCWQKSGHGAQTMTEALGNSCNPVMVQLALKMGAKTYYNYLSMFGFTDVTHIALPGEASAIIKAEKTVAKSKVDLATLGFGQGIAVTPIQLVTAISAVGNDGYLMKPRIVKEIKDSKGKTVKTYPTQKVRQVVSKKTAAEVRDMMEFEVSKSGGQTAKIPGYRIGGKTGTANQAKNGAYTDATWSSFVGMAPMESPKMTVLVVVDNPKGEHYGSVTAAPIARQFMKKALPYMEVKPQYTSKSSSSSVGQVPNVTGMSSDQAMKAIKGAGLKYKISPSTDSKKSFKVKAQYPKAGTVISKKDYVYIYRK